MKVEPIAHIRTDFPEKFGIPRQSGLARTRAEIIFEPQYRRPEALRGIEGFSHLWLLWEFSKAERDGWSPTVRPPRLGGNTRMGVFATRSPFRPNPIGLSCVTLEEILPDTPDGPVLVVGGADLLCGTPILDIKPYVPYADSRPEAVGGFADAHRGDSLRVQFPPALLECVPPDKREALCDVLAGDPRPSYQNDPARLYGVRFAEMNVRFRVDGDTLFVTDIEKCE